MMNDELKTHSALRIHNSELGAAAVLAANLFRATQTEEKLRRENIQGKTKANKTHFEVGKKVRQTIEELGGTMPENLPTPDEDLRRLEKRVNSLKKLGGENDDQ